MTTHKPTTAALRLLSAVDLGRVRRGFDIRNLVRQVWLVCDQHATATEAQQLERLADDGWITRPDARAGARAELTDAGREVLHNRSHA